MRFMTWNCDWWLRHKAPRTRFELIVSQADSVIALQELRGQLVHEIDRVWKERAVFSTRLLEEPQPRWMACALLFPAGTRIKDKGLVPELPKPQRGMWVEATVPGMPATTFVSWHTPNAAGDGVAVKMQAYTAMSDFLAGRQGPVVLGADLNTWRDPVELMPADPEHPFAAEHEFVGPGPRHRLTDAYRAVLARDGLLKGIAPDGPLAVSYKLGKAEVPHRMDRILFSGLTVEKSDYDYETGRAHGSDHAVHWASFAS